MDRENMVDHITPFLLRMPVGLLFLVAGIGKVGNLAGFGGYIRREFGDTFLAGPLLEVFIYVLPFVEVLVGVALVLGLLTRPALVAAGLTLIVLFFGKAVVQDYAVCAQNAIYIFMTVFALRTAEHNLFSVDHLIARAR
jgi:thiosulfate dehydrogenase [quinone] large subunit